MATTPHSLLDDTSALRALLDAMEAELRQAKTALKHRDLEIEHLKLQLAKLRRMRFGRSSEKVEQDIEQLELRLQSLGVPIDPESAPIASDACEQPTPSKPVRRPLPSHLPREDVFLTPSECQCTQCGRALTRLGEDVSEILEYVPARFKVIRQVRAKFACRLCGTIIQAPIPSRPIERGKAGSGLLAHVLVSKYADHLPLYRQSEIYWREGVPLERSTLADWVSQCSRLLTPLGEALGRYVLSGSTVHGDDTPVPVLAPGTGKTRTARFWTYVRDERPAGQASAPAVWFQYSPDRKGIHPQTHLKAFNGVLHADGYAGFNQLYASGQIIESACWAHVRRKFHDIAKATNSPIANEAIQRIALLYVIEKDIRGRPSDLRQTARQARAGPYLAKFKLWLHDQLTLVPVKSGVGQAISYALARWEALSHYTTDGRVEIDNNAAERALRAVALGRKNYLFMGSNAGGERAALMYSLIGTAKLNGVNPYEYLAYVLAHIADHPIHRIDELLPWQVARQLTAHNNDQEAA